MKKLFSTILVTGLLLCGSAYAGDNIFKCKFEKNKTNIKELIVKVEDNQHKFLTVYNRKNEEMEIIHRTTSTGEVITFYHNGLSETHDLVTLQNIKAGKSDFFRAFYVDYIFTALHLNTIRINTADDNLPISIYDSFSNSLIEGSCK